jgi:hypothetical protein
VNKSGFTSNELLISWNVLVAMEGLDMNGEERVMTDKERERERERGERRRKKMSDAFR